MSAREIPGPKGEILVRSPNWMGDLIMETPGFRALRAGFPEARISLAVPASLAPLIEGAPWFDEIWPLVSHRAGPLAIWREARALARGRRFDLAFSLPDSFESALLLRLAGARRIVGYARGWRRALLHDAIPLPSEGGRRLLLARESTVLGLVTALGREALGTELELFVTKAQQQQAAQLLAAHGIDATAPLVLLAPGASFGPSKLWPADAFAAVGDALASRGAQIAVIGSPAERGLCAQVVAGMSGTAADLAGSVGLGGLKALVRGARLLVGNDAGARHLAVAFGVPCVITMGPTALEKTNLNLERVSVLSAAVACRPCYLRDCPIDHRCMTRIPPEVVVDECERALAPGFAGAQRVVGGLAA
jgi:heptosyltransferase-2